VARKSKRRFVSAVALFAMALRLVVAFLFVPAAIIPGTPAEAGFEIVLCTEHGPMQVALDKSGKTSGEQQDEAQPICPFCYAGGAILFTLAPPLLGPLLAAASSPIKPPAPAVSPQRPRVFATSPRGPPSANHSRT
jgi:hypothetical protein